MKKPKISIEDVALIAKLMKESELDKKADICNPNWRMDLLGMVSDKKGGNHEEQA